MYADRPAEVVTSLEGYDLTNTKVICRADLLHAGEKISELGVISGSVSYNVTGVTRSTASLIVDDGGGGALAGVLSDLAPYGNEIHLYRGIRLPGHELLVSLGIFAIQSSVDDGHGTVSIEGVDRSQRFLDEIFLNAYHIPKGTTTEEAILEILLATWPDMPYEFAETNAPLTDLYIDRGDSKWERCQEIALATGCELFFDRDGVLVLRRWQSFTKPPKRIYEGTNLIECTKSIDRQLVFNGVGVSAENPNNDDDEGEDFFAFVKDMDDQSPTYWNGPFGHRPMMWSNQYVTTLTECQNAAVSILRRKAGSPAQYSLSFVCDPTIDAGDSVLIKRERLGAMAAETHLLDNVTIDLAATAMNAETRIGKELLEVE